MPAKPSYCARASFLSSPLKAFSPVLPSLSGIRSGASQSSEHEFLFCLHSSRASPRHRRVNSGKGSFPHLWGGGTPEEESDLQNLLRPSDALRGPLLSLSLSLSSPTHFIPLCCASGVGGKQLSELRPFERASSHLTEQNRQLMPPSKREPCGR